MQRASLASEIGRRIPGFDKVTYPEWEPLFSRWWGTGLDRKQMEIDIVSESNDGGALLLGEASWAEDVDASVLLRTLYRKAENFQHVEKREVRFGLWLKSGRKRIRGAEMITPAMVPFPAYAPKLNPDEGVWTHLKSILANGRPDTQSELMDVLADEIFCLAASQRLLRGCIHQSELAPFLP